MTYKKLYELRFNIAADFESGYTLKMLKKKYGGDTREISHVVMTVLGELRYKFFCKEHAAAASRRRRAQSVAVKRIEKEKYRIAQHVDPGVLSSKDPEFVNKCCKLIA